MASVELSLVLCVTSWQVVTCIVCGVMAMVELSPVLVTSQQVSNAYMTCEHDIRDTHDKSIKNLHDRLRF